MIGTSLGDSHTKVKDTLIMALSKAVLQGKLQGAQCSETVNSRVSIIIVICMKKQGFSSCLRAKAWCWRSQGSARALPCCHFATPESYSHNVATVTEREANHYLGF